MPLHLLNLRRPALLLGLAALLLAPVAVARAPEIPGPDPLTGPRSRLSSRKDWIGLRPLPGKTSAHVEFTRDGKYALLSIWEPDGFVIVYDGATLEEIKRIPMKKPVGKYNVFNKITRSEGTSH